MSTPTDRIFFNGVYHNDVFFQGHSHREAWMDVGGELVCVWRKNSNGLLYNGAHYSMMYDGKIYFVLVVDNGYQIQYYNPTTKYLSSVTFLMANPSTKLLYADEVRGEFNFYIKSYSSYTQKETINLRTINVNTMQMSLRTLITYDNTDTSSWNNVSFFQNTVDGNGDYYIGMLGSQFNLTQWAYTKRTSDGEFYPTIGNDEYCFLAFAYDKNNGNLYGLTSKHNGGNNEISVIRNPFSEKQILKNFNLPMIDYEEIRFPVFEILNNKVFLLFLGSGGEIYIGYFDLMTQSYYQLPSLFGTYTLGAWYKNGKYYFLTSSGFASQSTPPYSTNQIYLISIERIEDIQETETFNWDYKVLGWGRRRMEAYSGLLLGYNDTEFYWERYDDDTHQSYIMKENF